MRFLTMQRPVLAALERLSLTTTAAAVCRTTTPIGVQLAAANAQAQGVRYASVKAQGAYKKKSKRGIPKKPGAKRTGGASNNAQL